MQNEENQKACKSLGDRISQVVVDNFNSLHLKSGKPTIRSNGVQEWTVLSGLVALIYTTDDTEDPEIYPISSATGVKALPNRFREFSKGSMVHDLHAEILAIRLFNWFLLDECSKLTDKRDNSYSKIIETNRVSNGLFKLKRDVKLALFITEAPCGDASMGYLTKTLDDKEPWKEDIINPKKKQKLSSDVSVIRGRRNFDKLGIVRTKPGRSDSVISLSKSCSDKICLKQLTGITSSITSLLFPDRIYLDYLVLPEDKFNEDDINRCFVKRFIQRIEADEMIHPIEVIGYKKDDYRFHKPKNDLSIVPSQLSVLHVIPSQYIQVLNNGVKNGCFVKNNPPKSYGESIICNRQLYNKAQLLLSHNATTYIDLKETNTERQELKCKGQETLNNWITTTVDDFDLQ